MSESRNNAETLALKNLFGFGWVHIFLRWSPWLLGAEVQSVLVLMVSMTMCGATFAVLVILARGAQQDLESADMQRLSIQLAPTPKQARREHFVSIFCGVLAVDYFGFLFDGDASFWLAILQPGFYAGENVGVILRQWLVVSTVFFSGNLIVHIICLCHRQINLFTEWAKDLSIDLMHTEDHQVFTMQPMRYLLITVIFASLNIVAFQVLTYIAPEENVLTALVPLVAVMFVSCYAFVRPVAVIRKRIRDSKIIEIAAVRQALTGNRDALAGAQIADVADEFKTPDLMMYEQYIRGIWEWPVQGYVQRILLYVLLPPLAWVLAA